jgi:Domain of unknown function (DUF4384)
MTSRTQYIIVGALLAFYCISPSIAQDEDTSRSVRIIDGPAISSPPPPASADPSGTHPERPLSDKTEDGLSGTLTTSPDSVKPNPLPDAPPGAVFSPMQRPGSSPSGIGVSVVANPAELSIEMLPETSIVVGSRVSFRISAKKPGFLILMDIDSTGKVTQIYPSPVSLMTGRGKPNTNFVRPGKPIQIPSPVEPYMGFEFIASPPLGTAMVVAMLSDQPVQMIDLPDIPVSLVGQKAAVGFLSQLAGELRIPSARDDDNRLQRPTWSLTAKFYEIKQAPN